jgi:hypothetical protein
MGFEPPIPWGCSGRHCKNVYKKNAKIGFCVKKHDFRGNLIGFLQNSPDPIPKIGFRKKLFPIFRELSRASKVIAAKNTWKKILGKKSRKIL